MTKLVAAFLLISVGGMVLAAFFIQRSVTQEFEDYVITQQRNSFVTNVSNYYATNGSWQGVDRWLRESVFARRPGANYDPKHSGGPERFYPFVLIDAAGTVIGPFAGYQAGQRISQQEREACAEVTIDGQTVGYVMTVKGGGFRNPDEVRYLARTRLGLSIAAVIALSIALLFGIVLARLITRPLRELTVAAENIANGNLEQRVPVRSRDEIGVLATQFNRMSSDLNHSI
ncbi:MAG TPA: HAMP domain-containing protein, partial [Herpetosiphonaceae bacterium]|nr:HAMP domain-containing protein [Herpetosiphonaceae bacterium]